MRHPKEIRSVCVLAPDTREERRRRDLDAARRRDELEAEYRKGFEEATRRIHEQMQHELTRAVQWLEAQAEEVRGAREAYLRGAESEVLQLACSLAAKIIERQVELDPEGARPILERALAAVADRDEVVVRVSPERLDTFQALTEDVNRGLSAPGGVRWVADRRLPPSGIVVETEAGKLDARIETQLEEAALLFDEVLNERAA